MKKILILILPILFVAIVLVLVNLRKNSLEVELKSVDSSIAKSNLPDNFPLNGQTKIFLSEQSQVDTNALATQFTSTSTVSENYNFYKDYLSKTGWDVQSSLTPTVSKNPTSVERIIARREGTEIIIEIYSTQSIIDGNNENKTFVSINYKK